MRRVWMVLAAAALTVGCGPTSPSEQCVDDCETHCEVQGPGTCEPDATLFCMQACGPQAEAE